MTFYVNQVSDPTVERVERNGREYLSFPIVPLREMVYNYPEDGTNELLPSKHIKESVESWAGTPVTAVHPPDRGSGKTVNTTEAYFRENIGEAHEPSIINDGEKLQVNAFIDVEKAKNLGGVAADVIDLLENGETLATSPGYRTVGDEYVNGMHAGEEYDLVQGIPVPDHIAVFPEDEFNARCSPEDGCAAPRVNAVDGDQIMQGSQRANDQDIRESDKRRLGGMIFNALGLSDDDEEDECSEGPCTCGKHEERTNGSETGTNDDDDESVEEETVEEQSDNEEPEETMEEEETEETTTEEESPEEVESPETVQVEKEEFEALKAQVEQMQEVTANYEEKLEEQNERRAKMIANSYDISEEAAQDLPESAMDEMLENISEEPTERTNYGAVPGGVDRTPENPDEDMDDVPAAGRRAYEQRTGGD